MGNPLSDVSQSFWDVLHWVDSVMSGVGAESFGYQPLAPQFEYLQKVDTDEIRRIATDVWQWEQGPVHEPFDTARALIGHADRTLESWQGEAKEAYQAAVAGPKAALERVGDPAHSLGGHLHELADSYDTSLIELLEETIDATSELWDEVPDGEPDNAVEAVGNFIVLVLAIIATVIVFFQKYVEAITTNIDNVGKTIADCQALIASAKM